MPKKFLGKLTLLITAAVIGLSPLSSRAENFYQQGSALTYGGTTYYLNTDGGTFSYIPFQASTSVNNKNELGDAMLNRLPGLQPGSGTQASTAGFRYSGYESVRSGAQYLVKTAAVDGTKRHMEWTAKSLWNIGESGYVSFRYAGIGVTQANTVVQGRTVTATAITNPNFVSDWVKTSNMGGVQGSATVFTTDGKSKTVPVWGTGGDVYDISLFYANGMGQFSGRGGTAAFAGAGSIQSNAASDLNRKDEVAEETFRRWRDTEYGEAYWSMAEQYIAHNGLALEPWSLLNNIFKITGNVLDKKQSVILYCVCSDGSTKWYRTYSIPGTISNNTAATFLGIRDDGGIKVGEASRPLESADPYNGLNSVSESVTAEPIQLKRNTRYSIDAILSYYASPDSGKTETQTTTRSCTLGVVPLGTGGSLIYGASLSPASSIDENAYSTEISRSSGCIYDGKTAGSIPAAASSGGFRLGGAAFTTPEFYITDAMPDAGYIVITVPDRFSVNGDNDVLYDDRLMLRYTVTDSPAPPPPGTAAAYGDMNMGRRELRSYHYLTEEMVDDTDNPIIDPVTGEETGEYEQKEVTVEYWSDYGTYESASAGKAAADYSCENDSGPPAPDGKNIYAADDDGGWWEYTDREWPDQGEDALWKCWVAKGNSNTYDPTSMYKRGQYQNFPFSLGFAISRSKGEKDTTIPNPTLDINLYGVSPDTGSSGELIKSAKVVSGPLGVYEQKTTYLENLAVGLAAGNLDYPRLRIEAKIADEHGESGIYGGAARSPFNNGWESEHDSYDWTIRSEMEDMRIMEVEVKDSEGIVIYHADRYNTPYMEEAVCGYFDREEDLSLKVVIEQCRYIGHDVVDPTIDVVIKELNESGGEINTAVNQVLTNYMTLGDSVRSTYEGIYFRPKSAQKLSFSISIDDRHGADEWRENIWDDEEDSFYKVLSCTTADLALSQDIELYNSKGAPQSYLTFGEFLDFRYNVRHIGSNDRQRAIVGGSAVSPFVKVNTKIYNADELTYMSPTSSTLKYKMVAGDDPKRTAAFIRGDQIQTDTRLYPGLGTNGYASHAQAWLNDYVVQSHLTRSGNVAAYGHILVTGLVDETHDYSLYNIRDNTVDYVQKEFKGEKNFKIVDMAATNRNSVTASNPLKGRDPAAKDPGLSVQVAVSSLASSYNDQTVIDRTYLDIYIDDVRKTTAVIDVPAGQTVVTEITFTDVDLTGCRTVEARVNTGKHQTHYEYVLKETDSTLFEDPFADNYMTAVVCPNLPSTTICPTCIIDEDDQLETAPVFGAGGVVITPPVVDDVTDRSKYTVIYEANDGSTARTQQEIEYESTAALTANPFARPGYVFAGWNTKADGSGNAYADQAVMTVGSRQSYYGVTRLTLYAQWEPITYQIQFNGNGSDSGSMDPVSAVYGTDIQLPENLFSKTGYIFSCWSDQADGSGRIFADRDMVKNLSTSPLTPAVLFAQWYPAAGAFLKEYGYSSSDFTSLTAGKVIPDRLQLMNLLGSSTYGYIRLIIPTFDSGGSREDIFTPNIDTSKFTLVHTQVGSAISPASVYIYRYNAQLTSIGASGSVTSDLYTTLTVSGDYAGQALSGNFELDGIVLFATGEEVAVLDQRAIAAFNGI